MQSALKRLFQKVWLKNGAYLVFDYTEAMTVVDVNSSKFIGKTDMEETAFKINIEAANSLVRQIRLRNLSGIIIVYRYAKRTSSKTSATPASGC